MIARGANRGRQTFRSTKKKSVRSATAAPESSHAEKTTKQWECLNCGVPLPVDRLLDYKLGGKLDKDNPEVVGTWYVRGRCPDCGVWVQFTKHGAGVLRGPGKAGYPATVFTKYKPGRYME